MTNGEKNKKRFDELGLGDLPASKVAFFITVRKNGEIDKCTKVLCKDCIFVGKCYSAALKWLNSEAKPEKKEEKVKKEELKVGDTVKVRTTRMREGKIGTVKSIVQRSNGSKIYSVQLNGNGYGSTFLEHEIEKVKPKKTPPRIVIYQDGNTVTARDLKTGEEASTVCSKEDTYDLRIGAFIALSRLIHLDLYIKCMQREMAQLDSYISDIKLGLDLLMGDGHKQPEGFFRKEEE